VCLLGARDDARVGHHQCPAREVVLAGGRIGEVEWRAQCGAEIAIQRRLAGLYGRVSREGVDGEGIGVRPGRVGRRTRR
jgi:hypothetical protein